jgi:hypothetical protein
MSFGKFISFTILCIIWNACLFVSAQAYCPQPKKFRTAGVSELKKSLDAKDLKFEDIFNISLRLGTIGSDDALDLFVNIYTSIPLPRVEERIRLLQAIRCVDNRGARKKLKEIAKQGKAFDQNLATAAELQVGVLDAQQGSPK